MSVDTEPSVRWVADAMAILRAVPGDLNWDMLLAHARRFRFTLLLRATLRYLHDVLEAPVPSAVLQQLKRHAGVARRADRVQGEDASSRALGAVACALCALPRALLNRTRKRRGTRAARRVSGVLSTPVENKEYVEDRLCCGIEGNAPDRLGCEDVWTSIDRSTVLSSSVGAPLGLGY